jgi:hypothetical protein
MRRKLRKKLDAKKARLALRVVRTGVKAGLIRMVEKGTLRTF